jgi:23S rRNA (cytosine1962-C5)-methyltransferase
MSVPMKKLTLKAGRDKSLRRRHPWIFSGAVARVEGDPAPGDTVEVRSDAGEFLAVAAYSPESQIRARVWDWQPREIDGGFFKERVGDAVRARSVLLEGGATNAMRLVHGEADGLPGVVADRYAATVVVQLLSAGAERWREPIAAAFAALHGVAHVWERSDAEVRELEGLPARTGPLCGGSPPARLTLREHGLSFAIDVRAGHKTGFYLDQRENRLRLRSLAEDCDVLDCFCYTGGFALNALAGSARSVTAIESSGAALDVARENARLNDLRAVQWLEDDVFGALRRFRDERRRFDVVVLDPPKFAPTAAHAARAARAYKDASLLAFKLLRPRGALMTFSCSGGITADLFHKIVAGAALDAGVRAHIEAWLHAAPDHPVALDFPESEYLKGLLCRVAGK